MKEDTWNKFGKENDLGNFKNQLYSINKFAPH